MLGAFCLSAATAGERLQCWAQPLFRGPQTRAHEEPLSPDASYRNLPVAAACVQTPVLGLPLLEECHLTTRSYIPHGFVSHT